jgi:hypothetical protein
MGYDPICKAAFDMAQGAASYGRPPFTSRDGGSFGVRLRNSVEGFAVLRYPCIQEQNMIGNSSAAFHDLPCNRIQAAQ